MMQKCACTAHIFIQFYTIARDLVTRVSSKLGGKVRILLFNSCAKFHAKFIRTADLSTKVALAACTSFVLNMYCIIRFV